MGRRPKSVYVNGHHCGPAQAEAWLRAFPAEAAEVLLETGALERFADCGRCAGRDACQWVHAMNEADIPECVPVYRLVAEEDR